MTLYLDTVFTLKKIIAYFIHREIGTRKLNHLRENSGKKDLVMENRKYRRSGFIKAGIIKKEIPVIISETQVETYPIFIQKAKEENALILFADAHFIIEPLANTTTKINQFQEFNVYYNGDLLHQNLQLDLLGNYQLKNVPGVLQAIELLKTKGIKIKKEDVVLALKNIKKSTGLLGRWQILKRSPLTICDTGHNAEGITQVVDQIKITPHKRLHFILGLVKDKDPTKVICLLPKNAIYYFCKANLPRALDQNELAEIALKHGLKGKVYPSVISALHSAEQNAHIDDLIFIGGSTFIVAEVV